MLLMTLSDLQGQFSCWKPLESQHLEIHSTYQRRCQWSWDSTSKYHRSRTRR